MQIDSYLSAQLSLGLGFWAITTGGMLLAVWAHFALKKNNDFIEKPKQFYDYVIGIVTRELFLKDSVLKSYLEILIH